MARPVRLLEAIERQITGSSPDMDIEASAGFARGTYTKLMSGKTKLRMHHLESLCRALQISVISLFMDAYGKDQGVARLTDLLIRLMRPEFERLLRADGDFPTPEGMSKSFQQLQVEE